MLFLLHVYFFFEVIKHPVHLQPIVDDILESLKVEIEKREIKVVTGDGNDLNLSPVYDHIKSDIVPDNDGKKKDIVIPKSSSDKK